MNDDNWIVYKENCCDKPKVYSPSGERIKGFYSCHVDETSQEPKKIIITVWGYDVYSRKELKKMKRRLCKKANKCI